MKLSCYGLNFRSLKYNLSSVTTQITFLNNKPFSTFDSSNYPPRRRVTKDKQQYLRNENFKLKSDFTSSRISRRGDSDHKPAELFRIFENSDRPLLSYFVTCPHGFEEVVAAELSSPHINALNVSVGYSGVSFFGNLSTGYRANLWLRCGARVLLKLVEGEINPRYPSGDTIYGFIRAAVEWSTYLEPDSPEPPGSHKSKPKPKSNLSDRLLDSHRNKSFTSPKNPKPKARNFSVDSHVSQCDSVNNSQFASTRVKDAICDSISDAYDGRRIFPPEPNQQACLPIFISLYRNKITVYRDMSGMSLHKRGYRDVMHRASLKEGMAAAILSLSGLNPMLKNTFQNTVPPKQARTAGSETLETLGSTDTSPVTAVPGLGIREVNLEATVPGSVSGLGNRGVDTEPRTEVSGSGKNDFENLTLLDPMCGSGTFLIEAALMVSRTAPGLFRTEWPFEKWHDHDAELWHSCIQEAESLQQKLPCGMRLLGNDIHPGALSLCVKDARSAGVLDLLELSNKDIKDFQPSISPNIVFVNPPWGSRLENDNYIQEDRDWLKETWTDLGLFFKSWCRNANVFLLSGNSEITNSLCLKATKKWSVEIGGIPCKILHYSILPPRKASQVSNLKQNL